jgi:hypothetical protein
MTKNFIAYKNYILRFWMSMSFWNHNSTQSRVFKSDPRVLLKKKCYYLFTSLFIFVVLGIEPRGSGIS